MSGMFGVDEIRVINTFDTIRNLGMGMYASRLIAYDPIRMKYNEIKYDYFKDKSDTTPSLQNKKHNFVTMDGNKMIGVKSDLLGEHTSRTSLATTTNAHDVMFIPPIGASGPRNQYPAATSIGVTTKTFKDPQARSNHVEDWLLQRQAQQQEFDNVRLKLSVAGNSSRHVGQLIWFDFPSYVKIDETSSFRNQMYGGYYMVSKIDHVITQTRYTMDMEVVKNSLLNDLPGNDVGYDAVKETSEQPTANEYTNSRLADFEKNGDASRGF